MNDYFYDLAKESAEIAGSPIKPEYIYCQWVHESDNFTSDLAISNHNLGGLCQTQPNDTPQPDGNQFYINFPTFERYALYFGNYLKYYREDGIFDSQSIEDYVTALKHGEYFGDSIENYLSAINKYMEEYFPGVA